MKFSFKNIGYVDNGCLELGNLTILFGENNVGKTYLNYAIYGLLKSIKNNIHFDFDDNYIDSLQENGLVNISLYEINMLNSLNSSGHNFSENLHRYFNTNEEFFEDSSVGISMADMDLKKIIPKKFEAKAVIGKKHQSEFIFYKEEGTDIINITLKHNGELQQNFPNSLIKNILNDFLTKLIVSNDDFPTPFVITSERTGISLFYKELDVNKNLILETLTEGKEFDPFDFLTKYRSRYAQPIHDNIQVIRDYESVQKNKSFIREDKEKYDSILNTLQDIIGGNFKNSNKEVFYYPKKKKKRRKIAIPFYVASSSIKSMFLIDLYINCIAKKGGLLIIDEPELNLHPNNQRKIAVLLAKLINAGVKVLITTHSDYLVRELNNRIMLKNLSPEARRNIMCEYKISEDELLDISDVKAYGIGVENHEITEFTINEYGIDTKIFDTVINEANILNDKIYYSLGE